MYGLKVITKLQEKKYRQEYGCFFVDGKKQVFDAIASGAEIVQLVWTDRFARDHKQFLSQTPIQKAVKATDVLTVSESEFARLTDTTTPQGIGAIVQIPSTPLSLLFKKNLLVMLEDIRDPGNVGTMLRTADWFGVGGVILIRGADPYQTKVVRSSMGSIFHIPIIQSTTIEQEVAELKNHGFSIVVTRPEAPGDKKDTQLWRHKCCVVFGNEANGTSPRIDELADYSLSIPKFGKAESLNVAVSFGIVLYELKK